MTRFPSNLTHRHVDYETYQILYVDPATGEIISRKKMVIPKDTDADYHAWAVKRRSEDLSADLATTQSAIKRLREQSAPVLIRMLAKRGRPKAKYLNPAAALMNSLTTLDPTPWIDDIIHGSISTSAGVSNGKLNVKIRNVIGALFLSKISAESCQTNEYNLRTAQRIAKAARHTAHGIMSYLERHPKLRKKLEEEVSTEASLQYIQI